MIRWLALFWLAMAGIGMAAPVVVTSGEHEDFTRLVFDFGHPVDWQVGRTEDGYTLQIKGERPSYDLRQAFDLIGKSRLAAIWAEPETGALRLGVACACHGTPFEFRPGIVVIDLKNGPPPKGSSFELTLTGEAAEGLNQHAAPRPRPRPEALVGAPAASYDWMQHRPGGAARAAPLPPTSDPALQPLRDSLLRQLSRGAAEGVVEMNGPKTDPAPRPQREFPSAQVRIGDANTNIAEDTEEVDLTAEGADCLPDTRLTIADWGKEEPVSTQFSDAMAGLTGEFDRPDPQAVQRAIEFNLYLGFGAEARQLIRAFDVKLPDVPVWQSLAFLLDEEMDPSPAFAGQSACDSAAALWALLSDPPPGLGEVVNDQAIRRSFSALPLHLRRHVGPRLAERLMALGKEETARAIRDAILRAPGEAGAAVAVMEAEMSLHSGDPAAAERQIAEVLTDSGPDAAQALVAFVHARVAQSLPLSQDVVLALEAHLAERGGSKDAAPFEDALILAKAAAGDFASAFAAPNQNPDVVTNLWSLLVHLGPDEAVLAHAVLPPDHPPPNLPDPIRQALGERLLGLGFGDAARQWFERMAEPDPLLLAAADLQMGNARSVLLGLAGRDDTEALLLKAQAFVQIGDNLSAVEALRQAGLDDAALRATAHARDWVGLAKSSEGPWQNLAIDLAALQTEQSPATSEPSAGTLATGHQLVETSAATRASVAALLSAIPAPKALKQ